MNKKTVTTTAALTPPPGKKVVTLLEPIVNDIQFPNLFIEGDQILYPSILNVNANASISGPEGVYPLIHIELSGIARQFDYAIDHQEQVLSHQYISDKPTATDLLNRSALQAALKNFIKFTSATKHSTIAILGEWGIGKSTFLNCLKEDINNTSDVLCEVNAWLLQSSANMKASLYREIINSIFSINPPESESSLMVWLKRKTHKTTLLLKYAFTRHIGKGLFPIILLALLATLHISGILLITPSKILSNFFSTNSIGAVIVIAGSIILTADVIMKSFKSPVMSSFLGISKIPNYENKPDLHFQMRSTIDQLCKIRFKKNNGRIILLIDDLDRCEHSKVIQLIEAIRLTLSIDSITTIVAADYDMMKAAINDHYKEKMELHEKIHNESFARSYLAKIFSLSLMIPTPNHKNIKHYIKRQFEENLSLPQNTLKDIKDRHLDIQPTIMARADATQPMRVSTDFLESVTAICTKFSINNPRQIKRLINSYKIIKELLDDDDKKIQLPTPSKAKIFNENLFPISFCLFSAEYFQSKKDTTIPTLVNNLYYFKQSSSLEKANLSEFDTTIVRTIHEINIHKKANIFSIAQLFILPN